MILSPCLGPSSPKPRHRAPSPRCTNMASAFPHADAFSFSRFQSSADGSAGCLGLAPSRCGRLGVLLPGRPRPFIPTKGATDVSHASAFWRWLRPRPILSLAFLLRLFAQRTSKLGHLVAGHRGSHPVGLLRLLEPTQLPPPVVELRDNQTWLLFVFDTEEDYRCPRHRSDNKLSHDRHS